MARLALFQHTWTPGLSPFFYYLFYKKSRESLHVFKMTLENLISLEDDMTDEAHLSMIVMCIGSLIFRVVKPFKTIIKEKQA